jgi:hypothetical protein
VGSPVVIALDAEVSTSRAELVVAWRRIVSVTLSVSQIKSEYPFSSPSLVTMSVLQYGALSSELQDSEKSLKLSAKVFFFP